MIFFPWVNFKANGIFFENLIFNFSCICCIVKTKKKWIQDTARHWTLNSIFWVANLGSDCEGSWQSSQFFGLFIFNFFPFHYFSFCFSFHFISFHFISFLYWYCYTYHFPWSHWIWLRLIKKEAMYRLGRQYWYSKKCFLCICVFFVIISWGCLILLCKWFWFILHRWADNAVTPALLPPA